MAVTPRDLLAIAPEFEALEPDVIGQAILDAGSMVDSGFWGANADMATRYYAAHLLSLSNPGLTSAQITEETIGPLTVRYSEGQGAGSGNEELEATVYGRRFLEMIQNNPNSHFMVT